jgi:Spore coat associated protein JA (CotJA).
MITERNARAENNANAAVQAENSANAENAANAANASNNAPAANTTVVENMSYGKENKEYKTANNPNPLNQIHVYEPFIGPCDPCPPMKLKTYVVPPNQFITFQPQGLPQYSIHEALRRGTLWPALYSSYQSKYYL